MDDFPDEVIATSGGAGGNGIRLSAEVAGRYTDETEMTRGGMGRILLTRDNFLEREVVLKESLGASGNGRHWAEAKARFLREARITGQLAHPSIVQVHELGERSDGTLYYTMPRILGSTLAESIHDCSGVEERLTLLPHFLDTLNAIAYAHSRGVIHRDIKPQNVLVGNFGETLVIDWGLAKITHGDEAEEVSDVSPKIVATVSDLATRFGAALGTPEYMAPEQARGGARDADERSDVYSLGAVLFEMLTGQLVAESEKGTDHPGHGRGEIWKAVLDLEPAAPPDLASVCAMALASRPEDRFQTASEFVEDIERYLSGKTVRSHDYSLGGHLGTIYRRHRAVSNTVGVALLLIMASMGYYGSEARSARNAERTQFRETQLANEQLRAENYTASISAAQKAVNDKFWAQAADFLDEAPIELRGWEWYYLQGLVKPFEHIVPNQPEIGLDGFAGRVIISSDDGNVLTLQENHGAFAIYHIESGKRTFIGENGRFTGWPAVASFGPGKGTAFIGKDERTVEYYDFGNSRSIREFAIRDGWLWSFVLSPNRHYAAGLRYVVTTGEREVVLWDFESGEQLNTFPLNSAPADAFAGLPAGQRDFEYRKVNEESVLGGFLSDSETLVFVDSDFGTLSVATGVIHRIAPALKSSVAVDSGTNRAAFVAPDGVIEVYDVRYRKRIARFDADPYREWDLVFGVQGRLLGCVAGANHTPVIKVFDIAAGKFVFDEDARDVSPIKIGLGTREPMLVSLGRRQGMYFWNLNRPASRSVFPFKAEDGSEFTKLINYPGARPRYSYAFSADSRRMAWSPDEGEMVIWLMPDYQVEHTIQRPHIGTVTDIVFHPDGQRLATSGWDGLARIWDLSTFEVVREFRAPIDEACYTVAFSPDGSELAVGYSERNSGTGAANPPAIFEARSGRRIRTLDHIPGRAYKIYYNPDGRYMFIGCWGENDTKRPSFRILDIASDYEEVGTINGLDWGDEIAFLPDDRLVALGDSKDMVLFDLKTMSTSHRIPDLGINSIAVHPDGTRFTSVGNYRLNVHDAHDGRILVTFPDCHGPVFFANEGRDMIARTLSREIVTFRADGYPGR